MAEGLDGYETIRGCNPACGYYMWVSDANGELSQLGRELVSTIVQSSDLDFAHLCFSNVNLAMWRAWQLGLQELKHVILVKCSFPCPRPIPGHQLLKSAGSSNFLQTTEFHSPSEKFQWFSMSKFG